MTTEEAEAEYQEAMAAMTEKIKLWIKHRDTLTRAYGWKIGRMYNVYLGFDILAFDEMYYPHTPDGVSLSDAIKEDKGEEIESIIASLL